MTEPWTDLTRKLGSLVGKWTAYAAFGSFLLYLFGYLALRFQLSTYGVATNLDVLDEKYLFSGCRFLVFLATSVPNILIIVLVFVAIGYVPYKLTPVFFRDRLERWASEWRAQPVCLPLFGVVLAVVLIQFVLRKCFAFGNLLFARQLPSEWLSSVLMASDGELSLYFSALVGATLLTAGVLFYVLHCGIATTMASQVSVGILGFLVAVEFLLLPVNYGILISTQQLPRVCELIEDDKAAEGQSDWMVWDGKDAITYFVRDSADRRVLVTIPRKDREIRIVGYDHIFSMLFRTNHPEIQVKKP